MHSSSAIPLLQVSRWTKRSNGQPKEDGVGGSQPIWRLKSFTFLTGRDAINYSQPTESAPKKSVENDRQPQLAHVPRSTHEITDWAGNFVPAVPRSKSSILVRIKLHSSPSSASSVSWPPLISRTIQLHRFLPILLSRPPPLRLAPVRTSHSLATGSIRWS